MNFSKARVTKFSDGKRKDLFSIGDTPGPGRYKEADISKSKKTTK